MLRRTLLCLLLAGTLLPAAALPPQAPAASRLLQPVGPGTVDWRSRTLTVVGEGQAPADGSPAQQRLKARRAAVADGYRQLAEATDGVQVSVTYRVEALNRNPITKLKVQSVIKGAVPGEADYLPDGRVRVPLTMPLYGEKSLAWGVDLGRLVRTIGHTAAPEGDPAAPARVGRLPKWLIASLAPFSLAQTGAVTGLVVDAAGLGAEPAMAPFILGVGQRVYVSGKVAVDPDRIVQEGVTHYHEDYDEALADTARVGTNPLVVTAKGAVGRPSTDILLSGEDAARIEALNAKWRFLDQLRVTIVI